MRCSVMTVEVSDVECVRIRAGFRQGIHVAGSVIGKVVTNLYPQIISLRIAPTRVP